MGAPDKLTGTFTWNSHVRMGKLLVYRYLYMEFPCQGRGAPGLQVPLHGIPMSERGRRTRFHGNSHVNIHLWFSFTWQIPCKSALASFNEASRRFPRHISQSYLVLLSVILFSDVFHADDVNAKIWWCSGSLTSQIFHSFIRGTRIQLNFSIGKESAVFQTARGSVSLCLLALWQPHEVPSWDWRRHMGLEATSQIFQAIWLTCSGYFLR